MSSFQKLALALALLGVLALARSLYHWSRTARHLRPEASPLTPWASWLRDHPEHYAPEGRRQLALRLRWQWIGTALLAGAVVLNVLAHRPV